MIKMHKKEQLEKLKAKYSKEMLKEAEEIITLLDENYGSNRDLGKDTIRGDNRYIPRSIGVTEI